MNFSKLELPEMESLKFSSADELEQAGFPLEATMHGPILNSPVPSHRRPPNIVVKFETSNQM